MRTLTLAVLACLIAFMASAERLTITRMTGNTVNIGGKNMKLGGVFDEGDAIVWSSPTQKLEAKNAGNGSIYRFSAKQFASKNAKSVKDFFLRVNKASTRNVDARDCRFQRSKNASKYPEKRLALLMGNTNYTDISPLKNPVYDVDAMSEALGSLGFDVIEAYDCDYSDMKSVLTYFQFTATQGYDVVLFYYSGHGLQENGHNYLIPVNAKLEFKSELERCLDTYDVIDKMESTGVNTRIVCLDACRDVKTSWTRSSVRGLTTMEGSPGTAIICSTRSGQVALDGDGDNSPFVSSMIKCMGEKGRNFSEMMSNVVKLTYDATSKLQCPIVNGTLLSDFVFNPIGTVLNTVAAVASSSRKSNNVQHSAGYAASAMPSNSGGQSAQPQRHAPGGVVAEGSYDGVRIVVQAPRRSGNKVLVDVVLTNLTDNTISGGFCGKEPCAGYEGYEIAAWDDLGNEYDSSKVAFFKGTNRMYNPEVSLPPDVPVKYTLCFDGVSRSASAFALLSIAFRGFNPYESYGQALYRARRLPIM